MKISRIMTWTGFMAVSSFAIAAAADMNTANFVKKASVANQFEIASSKLALKKSQNADVKTFAHEMVTDHTKAGNDLKTAVNSSNDNSLKVSKKLDAKHQHILDQLKAESDGSFDNDYIKAQTDAHKEAVSLFGDFSQNGETGPVKDFATQTLPVLKTHLDHVQALKAQ